MNFYFTQQEADYILAVLAERQFKESAGMIQKIQQQAQHQIAPGTIVDTGDAPV
ncbi:MAG TPA: hypothetical protein VES38_06845 [Methylotenera sp.]|nr:hypothetical protein [Methylotenera sp.]